MQIRDVMTPAPATIAPEALLREAFAVMRERQIRRLPVVSARGSLEGIVTERDLHRAAARYREAPVELREIMSREVLTTTPDTHIQEAARTMMNRHIGALPVLGPDGALVGIVTETDIFKAFVEIMDETDLAASR